MGQTRVGRRVSTGTLECLQSAVLLAFLEPEEHVSVGLPNKGLFTGLPILELKLSYKIHSYQRISTKHYSLFS